MRQVGQAFSTLGLLDPRMNRFAPGQMDFRLTRLISGWKRSDGGAKRQRPLPKELLTTAYRLAQLPTATLAIQAMNRLMWLGFFFLLRPGEYLSKSSAQFPFKLKQVFFRIGSSEYHADTIPIHLLEDEKRLTFAGLQFDMQKNGVPDEKIGLGTANEDINPVAILANIVLALRQQQQQQTTGDTPLYIYYDETNTQRKITDRLMTKYLRGISLSVPTAQLPSIGALRCTGATALLEGGVDTSLIKLLGRWRSDEVFRYLHTQSEPMMQRLTDVLTDHIQPAQAQTPTTPHP